MIIRCDECGSQVSSRAKCCPWCGAPLYDDFKTIERHGTLCWLLGFFLHWMGIALGAIISGRYGAKQAVFGWLWCLFWTGILFAVVFIFAVITNL